MRKDAPLHVEVPTPDDDRPAWVKVGVIAAVGFVIGIAWPRVMGVRLGPNAPGTEAAAASASGKRAPDVPPASVAVKAPAQASVSGALAAPPAPAGPVTVSVQKGAVLGCKGDDGESKKGKECGAVPSLDQIVAPRLRKLSTCGAADGQSGKLSFVVNADFASGRFNWDVGKSSTIGNMEGITTCLKTIFQGVTLVGAAHENSKYTVAYPTTFALDKASSPLLPAGDKPTGKASEPSEKPDDKADALAPAGGEATVSWEVGLVRDQPKMGAVVARLPRGTKVKIGASKDGWYAIKYGDTYGSDGFLYRGAVGR